MIRIEGIRKLNCEPLIDAHTHRASKRSNATPSLGAVCQDLGASNERNLAVTKLVKMLDGDAGAGFVIDLNGTDRVRQFPSDDCGGNVALLEVGKYLDVNEEPVGDDDQAFHATLEQQFEGAFKAGAIVMRVGKNGNVRRL